MFAIQQGKPQRKDRSGPGTETLALIPHKSDKMMWKWLPLSARTFLFTFIDLEGSVSNKQDVITTLCSVIRFLPFLTRLVWLMLRFLLRASTSWFMPVSIYTVTVFTWQNIFVSSLFILWFHSIRVICQNLQHCLSRRGWAMMEKQNLNTSFSPAGTEFLLECWRVFLQRWGRAHTQTTELLKTTAGNNDTGEVLNLY